MFKKDEAPISEVEPASTSSSQGRTSPASMSDLGLPTCFGKEKAFKRKSSLSSPSDDITFLVEQLFSKNFEFNPEEWVLPDAACLFQVEPWKLDAFQHLKEKLNKVKKQLNDLPLKDWHEHTKSRSCAGKIVWLLKRKVDPELLTQAWCKFYELVFSFPLIANKVVKEKRLSSVHLCEAPGAFITSLNHYLHSVYGDDVIWDWKATTLNPYYEENCYSAMINDDRFILHTLEKWMFGEDCTGDLMTKCNLQQLIKDTSTLGEILLVTADGSIDCQGDASEQEAIVSRLLYCETICALNLLAPHGNFLLKMFTVFESSSICLLYLLNCVFKNVHISKPVCSKAGNSEIYIICREYHGKDHCHSLLTVLNDMYGNDVLSHTMFSVDSIPSDFIEQLLKCSEKFTNNQIRAIEDNIRSFWYPSRQDRYITGRLKHEVAQEFLERFKLVKLSSNFNIINKPTFQSSRIPNLGSRIEYASYYDRQKRLAMSPVDELRYLHDDLAHITTLWPSNADLLWMNFPTSFEGLLITQGKAIRELNSSKFCSGRLLTILQRIKCIGENHFNLNSSTYESSGRDLWPIIDNDANTVKVYDVQNVSLETYDAQLQKKALRDILCAVLAMVPHQSFQLLGFPLLTQLNVGLIYMLSHLFEKVGFVRPQGERSMLVFVDFRQWNPLMNLYSKKLLEVVEGDHNRVLAVVPITQLSGGDYYEYITVMNNLCLEARAKALLNKMSVI